MLSGDKRGTAKKSYLKLGIRALQHHRAVPNKGTGKDIMVVRAQDEKQAKTYSSRQQWLETV